MPEQHLTPEQEPKDWERNPLSPEQIEANQIEAANGWNLAQTGLPMAVGAAAMLKIDIGSVVAEAPKDVPDPLKGAAIGVGAAALTWVGVRVVRFANDRLKASVQEPRGSKKYMNEIS